MILQKYGRVNKLVNYTVDINIDLDLSCFLFHYDELDMEERYYLFNHGYDYGDFVPIGCVGKRPFLVKQNSRESLGHTFLVHNIKEELVKFGVLVQTFITVKPDLVFTSQTGKRYAVEVETGKRFRSRKKEIREKFKKVLEKYDIVIIVVTTTKVKRHYQRLLPQTLVLSRTGVRDWLSSLRKNNEI